MFKFLQSQTYLRNKKKLKKLIKVKPTDFLLVCILVVQILIYLKIDITTYIN